MQITDLEDFERIDELKRECRQERKRKRRNKLLWHALLCSAVVIIFVSIAAVFLKAEANQIAAENADVLKLRVETAPEINVQLLSINEYSRPGIELSEVNGVVIHYTGNPGTTAMQNRNYFEGLAEKKDTKASSHFIVGLSGEIIQCVPLNEIAYASNQRNADTISIECCINNEAGKFTDKTYDALVHLTAWLVGEYDLKISDIIRHYDVTGKACPKYFVEHESAWEDFKLDVEKYIDTNGVKK